MKKSKHLKKIIDYKLKIKKQKFTQRITKRSFKTFTSEKWNECLELADWSKLDTCSNVNEMTEVFTKIVTGCLDEMAPILHFSLHYSFIKVVKLKSS